MIKKLLFDVGDTLVDRKSWIVSLKELLYERFAAPNNISKEDSDKTFKMILDEIEKKSDLDPNIDKIGYVAENVPVALGAKLSKEDTEKLRIELFQLRIKNTKILDNSDKILQSLSKRFELYITSDARSENARDYLSLFDKKLFKDIFISEEVNARKSENGAMFKVFLERTKANPNECLVIGDDIVSDGSAKQFGMKLCIIDRKKAHLDFACDANISSLSELEGAINKINSK